MGEERSREYFRENSKSPSVELIDLQTRHALEKHSAAKHAKNLEHVGEAPSSEFHPKQNHVYHAHQPFGLVGLAEKSERLQGRRNSSGRIRIDQEEALRDQKRFQL